MFAEILAGTAVFFLVVYYNSATIEKYLLHKPGEGELKMKIKKKKRKLHVVVTGNKTLLLQNYKIPAECDFYITSSKIDDQVKERKYFLDKYKDVNFKKIEKFGQYLVPDIIKKKDMIESDKPLYICVHDFFSECMYIYKCEEKFIDYEEIISKYENDSFEGPPEYIGILGSLKTQSDVVKKGENEKKEDKEEEVM